MTEFPWQFPKNVVLLICLLVAAICGTAQAKAVNTNNNSPTLIDYDTILKLQKLLIEPMSVEEEPKDRATLLNSELLINHELVRKSAPNRTPSLRLRFGRRSESPMGVTINEQLEMPVGHFN
ncbi:uncharacterized protein LOC132203214 [Neocloeon triangulifer]|uniref:uncharacterized protein LOC132203214 n=1 Tax=Neocloeon triangulifer TaxID=2078957 RepID=UPI00286F8F8A|nr:uncharacterized protein LOC132203214 [Neocloeon triangulifer]XP_059486801.1 uncharacterized protein LOC132203214 [Neocloeon triangulifer]